MEKSVEQKVKECRQVIIQNMEKTLQHKMVYMFLKERKIDADVKQFSVNGKDGIIKVEFNEHEKARKFYDDCNFSDKILVRPFNIYFNLQLSEAEMKKFYLEGITEQNQQQLFKECRNIGVCKLYTSYGSGARGKLKPNGVLSFIRKQNILEDEFKTLTESLKKLGIKISNYIHEKGVRCSINVLNFYKGDTSKEESEIQTDAEKVVRSLIQPIVKDEISQLSVIVKKREANAQKNEAAKTFVTALVEFTEVSKTMDNFELLRAKFVNEGDTKAILFFHNEENNSFVSLFTSNLAKPEGQTEKQFEAELLAAFRKVNAGVIQVNVYPVKYNQSYIGRVYLRSEQDGKDFIVDYVSKREVLLKCYKDKHGINFNINVDNKTLRKINIAQKKAGQISENVKKYQQSKKRETKRQPLNNMPIQYGNFPGNFPQYPGMMPNMPNMANMPNMPSMLQGGIPQIGLPQMGPGMPFNNPMGDKMGMPGNPQFSMDPKRRIQQVLKDKATILSMPPQAAKRQLFTLIQFSLEENGVPQSESTALANTILAEQMIPNILSYLENPEELKKRISLQK